MAFKGRLAEICKIEHGSGACSFIVCAAGGFRCGKVDDALRRIIAARRLSGEMSAQGDNCDGVDGDLEAVVEPASEEEFQ